MDCKTLSSSWRPLQQCCPEFKVIRTVNDLAMFCALYVHVDTYPTEKFVHRILKEKIKLTKAFLPCLSGGSHGCGQEDYYLLYSKRSVLYSLSIYGTGVEPSSLLLCQFLGLLCHYWMILRDDCEEISGKNEWQGEQSTRRNLPQCCSVHHRSYMTSWGRIRTA
jgi:hypothetical protein